MSFLPGAPFRYTLPDIWIEDEAVGERERLFSPLEMHVLTDLPPNKGLQWEDVGCPLCGSRQSVLLIQAPDPQAPADPAEYRVVRCTGCGMAFTNPRPTAETIGLAYPVEYGPHQGVKQTARRRHWWSRPMARWRGRRELAWQGQGRLLDFGCGAGSFLLRMHEAGWRVVGLDASPAVVQRIRGELGLPALLGALPHPELPAESFDVVTMWQALEHVHNPLAVLQAARRLLVPGGRLIVAVPNLDSAPFRWFGRDWFGLDLPRHLSHFTPETLRHIVERAGFRVEQIRHLSHASWLHKSAQRAQQRGVSLGWRRCLLARSICRLATAWCVCRGISDAICLTAVAETPVSG